MAYKTLTIFVMVLAAVAAWIVVPEFRKFFGLPLHLGSTPELPGRVAPSETPAPERPEINQQASPSGNPHASSVTVTEPAVISIRSQPDAAEAYLEWKPRGLTPTTLGRTSARGLLVVVKNGYRAAFKRIEAQAEGEIAFTLQLDANHSRKRLLLVLSGGGDAAVPELRGRLIEEGFSVLGTEDAREFQRESERAGGLSNRALRAWARSRFDADLLLTVRVQQNSRDLGDQELGLQGAKEAVKGAIRAEVGIDAEVTDLRSGDSIAAVSAKGSGFALDRAQGFQKATTQAATESAKLVRQKIQG